MAHKKGGGAARNNRDSNAQRRGVKLFAGEVANTGSIIIRQCGTKFLAGQNVGIGRDYSLFALKPGVVKFIGRKVHVVPSDN